MADWNTPGARLKWAREQAGYGSPSDAARAIGVKEPTYLGHENNSRGLSRAGARYARFFGVRLEWLLERRGPPKLSAGVNPDRAIKLTTRKPSLIESYDPDVHRDDGAVHADGRINLPPGEIPQVSARLGLGHAADAETSPVVASWKIPESILRRRVTGLASVHIIECEGDSMEPRIRDGDFVFIDTSRRVPSPPGIFAINDGFGQTLKRLELVPNSDPTKVKIIPENTRHETYERALDDVRIIGRYLCRLTMD